MLCSGCADVAVTLRRSCATSPCLSMRSYDRGMSQPRVSVILPLFGDHRAAGSLAAVCRAWLRQDVDCEVVVAVAEGTPPPPLPRAARVRLVPGGDCPAAPGPLRNLAAAASDAPVLYLGDGDIVPLGDDYLRRALAVGEGRVLIQPWMYRLVNPSDVQPGRELTAPGGGRLCHVTLTPGGTLEPLGPERFTWLNPEIMVVEPPPSYGWRDEDGTPWPAFPFHWGGFLLDRAVFEAVGGYSTRYAGWGCEDDDLIAKLEARATVLRGWRVARRLTCLHLEHPRTHTAASIGANQRILAERLAAGADAMIAEDLRLAIPNRR